MGSSGMMAQGQAKGNHIVLISRSETFWQDDAAGIW
jgi:hypothetical protein